VTRRELTVWAQVANRTSGRTAWFAIAGSCTSETETTTAPVNVHTATTALLGHAYRLKAEVKVRAAGGLTSTTTVYGGSSAP